MGNSDRTTRYVAQTLGTNHTRHDEEDAIHCAGHRIYVVRISLGSGRRFLTMPASTRGVRCQQVCKVFASEPVSGNDRFWS